MNSSRHVLPTSALPLPPPPPPLPLPSLTPPDIYLPPQQLSVSSGGRPNTTILHLQLMALQCLLGSTRFAASCIENANTADPSPTALLLSSFYAQMLLGSSRATVSCRSLLSQLLALHPSRNSGSRSVDAAVDCNWVTCTRVVLTR